MHSTCLRALSALAVGLGLSLGSTSGFAQLFQGEDAGFAAPEGDASVLPADSKLMRLFEGGCVLTEGVAAGHDGMMYFSDITFTSLCKDESGKYPQAGNIWEYDPQTGESTVWRSPSGMSNGLKFDKDGNLIAALGADYGGRMLTTRATTRFRSATTTRTPTPWRRPRCSATRRRRTAIVSFPRSPRTGPPLRRTGSR